MATKLVIGLGLLMASALTLAAEDDDLVLWDKTVNIRGALGYKDNVLLSKSRPQGSAFWQSAVDVMFLRASAEESAGTFSFFATGEDRRYFSSPEVRKEQLVLGQGKFEKPFFSEWKAGMLAQ